MRHTLIALSAFCLLFVYCTNQGQPGSKVRVLDVTGNQKEVPVKLSDIAEDISIVRLEVNEDALLRRFWGYVGEKNIIATDYARILLFSADGSFICEIARRGKGPGEYVQVDAWTVDEREQYFIYHEVGKGYLNRYNLHRRSQEGTIPLPGKGGLGNLVSLNDTLLAVLPGMFSDYGYRWFIQDTTGKIVSGIRKEPVPHPGAWAGRSPVFIRGGGNSVIFQPSESDTVFRIMDNLMHPEIVFTSDKPSVSGDVITGWDVTYLHQNEKQLLLRKSSYEKTVNELSASISTTLSGYLVFDRKTGDLKKASRFLHDFEGIELPVSYIAIQGNGRFFGSFQALEFRQVIKEAMGGHSGTRGKSDGLNSKSVAALEKLMDEISDDDNPVIITGRLK